MEYTILIIGIFLVLLSIVWCAVEDSSPFIVISSALGTLFMICAIDSICDKEPKAIDVYRGNTTLKISYVDSVATDSVVVFKNK